MSTYIKTYLKKEVNISQAIPGRSKEMKKNLAGGMSFKADKWIALRRWLLTGSMTNLYHQNSTQMTELNIELLSECVKIDAIKVAEEILYASSKGLSNHTPLLALVYLSMGEFVAKKKFRDIFNTIVRTGSHLYEFFSYCKALRGFGKTIHKAVGSWLDSRDAKELEYQFLKYQQRDGWSARDVLRLMKPKTEDEAKNFVYKWAVGKADRMNELYAPRITVYESLKKDKKWSDDEVVSFINEYNLTHEMIPANIKRTTPIWEALYHKMPVGATIRNLGNLTDKGVFSNLSNINILEKRLSKEVLSKGRVHPLTIANAYKVYANGCGIRGNLSWNVIPRICDALEEAIETAFDVIEPTNKVFYHALDISPSMKSGNVGNLMMTPREIEAIMALTSIRSEKNYFVGGFASDFIELSDFRKTMSFSNALEFFILRSRGWGGTNAASAYKYATYNKIYADVFVFWTDSESWMGGHPAQALAEYREKVNKNAKAIYVTLTAYGDHISLVDPKDSNSYDLAGFSSETPKLIQLIAKGDL